MENQAAQMLRTWGELGARFRGPRRPTVNWEAASRLIDAARTAFVAESERLRKCIAKSKEHLKPLDEPLLVDFGLHRWLSGEREEAYSDWLQWIVEQVKEPELVLQLFGLQCREECRGWNNAPLTVARETTVPSGHVGHTGRLDLVIRYRGKAVLVIEVKKTDADKADTVKQVGYRQWLNKQPEPTREAVLLATASEVKEYPGEFTFCSWADLCVKLRRIVPNLLSREASPTAVALMLAFVGAVEQNLLGFSSSLTKWIWAGHAAPFDASIVDHLSRSLKGNSYD